MSTDSHFVHKAWADASETIAKIQYPMLADPTGKLTRAFDVMIEEEGMALRGSFVVNPEGVIKAYEIHDNGIGRDADELFRKVTSGTIRCCTRRPSLPGQMETRSRNTNTKLRSSR